jgi:hypothetical protein
VDIPKDIACQASVTLKARDDRASAQQAPVQPPAVSPRTGAPTAVRFDTYNATLTKIADKSGELFVAVDKTAWDAQYAPKQPSKPEAARQASAAGR